MQFGIGHFAVAEALSAEVASIIYILQVTLFEATPPLKSLADLLKELALQDVAAKTKVPGHWRKYVQDETKGIHVIYNDIETVH